MTASPARAPLSPVAEAASWVVLITELPREDVTARMAALRALETLGAVALRDGVFFLPDSKSGRESLATLSDQIRRASGAAHLFAARTLDTAETVELVALFDRTARYAELVKTIESLRAGFGVSDPSAIAAVLAKQRRDLEALKSIDFFPSALRNETERVLVRAEKMVRKLLETD